MTEAAVSQVSNQGNEPLRKPTLDDSPRSLLSQTDKDPLKGYAVQAIKEAGVRWLILQGHPEMIPPQRGS